MERNARGSLTNQGLGAVSMAVADCVLLASHGLPLHAAALAGVTLLLTRGLRFKASRNARRKAQCLRFAGWCAVAGALYSLSQGTSAPGGATLGLTLAVTLAVTLKLTR